MTYSFCATMKGAAERYRAVQAAPVMGEDAGAMVNLTAS